MSREQLSLPFSPIRNSGLFSNHWLEHRLPLEPEWAELREEATNAIHALSELWEEKEKHVEHYANEQTLEVEWIQPVLRLLGWQFDYQTFLRGDRPDYALFLDDAAYDAALKSGKREHAYWDYPTLLGDAKAWHVNLDRPQKVNNKREYPPEQIERYLRNSNLPFGLLTNGRTWRLYPATLTREQARFETYIEGDLTTILRRWRQVEKKGGALFERNSLLDDFMPFFLFFSPLAFRAVGDRQTLIERAIKGSSEYRIGVGEGLRDRVFEALRLCIEGFMQHRPNGLDAEKHLAQCREQSFIFLYRLLFIVYAEDRLLLPHPANELYARNRSLRRHRHDIAAQLDQLDKPRSVDFHKDSTSLYEDLLALFDLINTGGARYNIPAYNGGLFDSENHPFLDTKRLSDWYLARVIDQLSRAKDPERPDLGLFRVDYRDLAIQHLGSVYEGLLEVHPRYASQPMIVVRREADGRIEERTIAESESLPRGFERTGIRYQPGEVYLETDKGERRSSGSYYTPNHIVDYIVEQTISPLCRRIDEQLTAELQEAETEYRRARGQRRQDLQHTIDRLTGEFDDRVLCLRVLDPAMGSGHFLIRACQYLAEEIATNPHTRDAEGDELPADESAMTFWKRRVVEHCLYGVDLNPMAVELAKLALWLETVAVGQPLTFLDHHLHCGNSLVGAEVASMGVLPGAPPLQENAVRRQAEVALPLMLRPLSEISSMPSLTREQVKAKDRLYRNVFEPRRQPLLAAADLWCSTFFAPVKDQVDASEYQRALAELDKPRRFAALMEENRYKCARAVARDSSVSAFHWELEFPEAFFTGTGPREDAGFDAIIGNPPYDVLAEKELGRDLSAIKGYIAHQSIYEPSRRGKNNLYKLFICRALMLLAERGRLGFITPMAVLGDDAAADIRKFMLRHGAFQSIEAFPQKDNPYRRVFREAKLSTAAFIYARTNDTTLRDTPIRSRVHPAQFIVEDSPSLLLRSNDIPRYDPSNMTIVSCAQADWDTAMKIVGNGRMARLGDFAESFQGEVNETRGRDKGTISYESTDGPEVLRGAHVGLYAVREASQGTPLYIVRSRFLKGVDADVKANHHRYARVGFQRKSPQNNFRRLIACPIAAGQFTAESISYVPAHRSAIPLEIVLALLNSKLAEWYFRMGSTNAMVGEYQLKNLPCPAFGAIPNTGDRKLFGTADLLRRSGKLDECFEALCPALQVPPFSSAVRDIIVALAQQIIQIENGRGDIARSERSRLAPAAQPYQDLLDRLFFAMAGLTDAEGQALEERLSQML
jgi:type I restriction-modification system DNA methylase subunit